MNSSNSQSKAPTRSSAKKAHPQSSPFRAVLTEGQALSVGGRLAQVMAVLIAITGILTQAFVRDAYRGKVMELYGSMTFGPSAPTPMLDLMAKMYGHGWVGFWLLIAAAIFFFGSRIKRSGERILFACRKKGGNSNVQ